VTNRPAIPRQLEREVLIESGHRCGIPTCHQVPVEMAHIIPWEKVHEHSFENLIALCPTCHTRYDKGEIDRKAMLQYKANLSVLNGRYGDLERRVLRYFAERINEDAIWLVGGLEILIMNLLKDDLIIDTGKTNGVSFGDDDFMVDAGRLYQITAKGKEFIQHWLLAEELE